MKRHYLGVLLLALAAAAVVWVAIRQRPAASAAVVDPPTASIPVVDAGRLAAADPVAEGGPTAPPAADDVAWSVVRWSMSAADVERALKEVGVDVVEATDPKTGAKRLRAKSGPWDAAIDFAANRVDRIVVTTTNLSKEGAAAVVAKVNARAPATKTVDRTERRWEQDGGAVVALVTSEGGTVREEHEREKSPGGAIGFEDLRWGMSAQEVVGHLRAAGYGAHVVDETVAFDEGDASGVASFNQFGLRHVAISGAAARAKQLESSLGEPASVEASTRTQHVDEARKTSIQVDVKEAGPGAFTVVETYRPRK